MEEKIENQNEKIDWHKEALGGNFMPAIIMLEQKKINVDDIVDEDNNETLLHLAGRYSFYNVLRTLIEKYHADINIRNKNGHTLLFLIVGTNDYNIINFSYLLRQEKLETDIYDNNGMSPLVHSVMTSFHFAFLSSSLLTKKQCLKHCFFIFVIKNLLDYSTIRKNLLVVL